MVNSALIAAICSAVSTNPGDVCPKTTEALGRQAGVYQIFDQTESYIRREADSYTPETLKTILVYVLTINSMARGEDLRFYFKIPGVCDTVGIGGSISSQSVDMHWNF